MKNSYFLYYVSADHSTVVHTPSSVVTLNIPGHLDITYN